MNYEAKLQKPYSGHAHEAKTVEITITTQGGTFPAEMNMRLNLSLSDAADLMRQLADQLGEYRDSVQNRYKTDINKAVNELEEMLK